MDFTDIKALAVDINVDDELLTKELLAIPDKKWYTGRDYYSGHVWKNIFLTKNNHQEFQDFKSAKLISHSEWYWDETLDIPYIRALVESLHVKTIGMVRAFVLNGPLVMHVDSNEITPTDISYKVGLTIASKLDHPMNISDTIVEEKYIFFNDSLPHGFPEANGQQISIRVFGDFDYDKFKIIKVYK